MKTNQIKNNIIEAYRNKIEFEHNDGIPVIEWESMEDIIKGYQTLLTVNDTASTLGIPKANLRAYAIANDMVFKNPKRKSEKRKLSGAMRKRSPQIRLGGFSGSVRDWSEKTGINQAVIKMRLHRGSSVADAVRMPPMSLSERGSNAVSIRWNQNRKDYK